MNHIIFNIQCQTKLINRLEFPQFYIFSVALKFRKDTLNIQIIVINTVLLCIIKLHLEKILITKKLWINKLWFKQRVLALEKRIFELF